MDRGVLEVKAERFDDRFDAAGLRDPRSAPFRGSCEVPECVAAAALDLSAMNSTEMVLPKFPKCGIFFQYLAPICSNVISETSEKCILREDLV